jgi:hypothetical protein
MAFEELKSSKSWDEAKLMLLQGASAQYVADFMRERGDFPDIKSESLTRQLNRWRTEEGLDEGALVGLDSSYISRQIEHFRQKFEEIPIMETLCIHQMGRLLVADRQEQEKEELIPRNLKEITTLFDMLEKLATLKGKLGGGRNIFGPGSQSIDGMYKIIEENLDGDEFDRYLEDARKRNSGAGGEVDDNSDPQDPPENTGGAEEVDY